MRTTLGIDVHQARLTVAQHDRPVWTVARTEVALTTLALRVQALHPDVIVRDPSGGAEQLVVDVLHRHDLAVARVSPNCPNWGSARPSRWPPWSGSPRSPSSA
ncbi:MAG: hypothetical protein M3457_08655, partial [Chloroflexota bacterium]|nr:hypothetical protein [Chloroflexota bacterium]